MTDQKRTTTADIEALIRDKRAIIEARKTASIESIPALPQRTAAAEKPLTQPAAVQTANLAPKPEVSDAQVGTFLDGHLPGLIRSTRELVTPPFNFAEVINLGVAVSEAVRDGLPQVKGAEARALVVVTSRYLWRTYAVSQLPATVKPFAGLLEQLLITGLEAAYQLVVKRKA